MSIEAHHGTSVDMSDFENRLDGNSGSSNPEQSPETPDNRVLSEAGSSLVNVATRINSFLERHQLNKAHKAAIRENTARDNAILNEAYDEEASRELAKLRAQNEAMTSYSDNFVASYKLSEAQKKAEKREKIDAVKESVRGVGRRTLDVVKTAGLVTLGVGILAAERGAQAAKNGLSKFADVKDASSEAIGGVREAMSARKAAAQARKNNRTTQRAQRKAPDSENSRSKGGERMKNLKWSLKAKRSAARAALLTYKDIRDALKEQNPKER